VKGAGPTQAGPFYGDCPFALHVLNRTRHLTCMFCVFCMFACCVCQAPKDMNFAA
jgi:hypothetical protein